MTFTLNQFTFSNFHLDFYFPFLFGLLFPFFLWTFISFFYLNFYFPYISFSFFSLDFYFLFWLLFNRGHILDIFQKKFLTDLI